MTATELHVAGVTRASNRPMSSHEYLDGPDSEGERIELTSWTVANGIRPAECTLFPRKSRSSDNRMAAWITATGDSFVDCQEMR